MDTNEKIKIVGTNIQEKSKSDMECSEQSIWSI